jgi:hypothetical protein
MFQNYSETFATQIVTLAGFIVILGRANGWELMEGDIIFALGVLANLGGAIYTLYKRYQQGGVTVLGVRS